MAYRWVVLIFGMLAYTASYFARTNYTGIAKFVSEDLGLDKASLGVMGSMFFYAYALAQMPWGVASDKFGSRKAVSIGIFATALALWGFSTSATYTELKVWRALTGVAAAGTYVAMAGALSRWFSSKELALSQALFAAVGATAGELTANVLMPYLASINIGWRSSTAVLALIITGMGILCAVFLRSAPAGQKATERKPFEWSMLRSADLWCYTFVYSGSIIAIRVLPPWLPIYAADIYMSRGMELRSAVLAGGVLSTFYLAGRLIGVPVAGFLSDRLITRGISRRSIAVVFLLLTVALLWMMPVGIRSTQALAVLAFALGMSINMYPLITSAISEAFGAQKTSSAMGFLNTFAQLAGATALAMSGWIGIALSSTAGNSLDEYRGIWLVAIAGCLITVVVGLGLSVIVRRAKAAPATVDA
ncbi:MAG: MFS transporter [Acidobacteria bacterium]|nr:MFS transporter [Acidobacteriota bacterium]